MTGAVLLANGALILFALGAEMGERLAALAGAALAIGVLIRRLMRPVGGAGPAGERN